MSVTPNYNWPLIEPTDFVTNLPADFEAFGDAVDTTLEAIETKLDVITTEGDLIVGDASGDPDRLPIGAAGTVLTSDGDTADWVSPTSGSFTLISTTSLSGASVTLTSIPQIYKMLRLILKDYTHDGTVNRNIQFTVNSTTAIYGSILSSAAGTSQALSSTTAAFGSVFNASVDNLSILDFYEYSNTTTFKSAQSLDFHQNSATPNWNFEQRRHAIRTTSGISSITLQMLSDNFNGGTVELYGVN